jgi:hypothetical protein
VVVTPSLFSCPLEAADSLPPCLAVVIRSGVAFLLLVGVDVLLRFGVVGLLLLGVVGLLRFGVTPTVFSCPLEAADSLPTHRPCLAVVIRSGVAFLLLVGVDVLLRFGVVGLLLLGVVGLLRFGVDALFRFGVVGLLRLGVLEVPCSLDRVRNIPWFPPSRFNCCPGEAPAFSE